eukprot:TRINITY_DN76273_c0_g1_i1.p1 TRINITY_DN76273_c0_g1~~TRINITY_DN76273_c0_g1_i1.p1  ORF type:complete len:912 (-),score=172.40 TRINITY_DN76273_c0_g1_i1:7-2742(-)
MLRWGKQQALHAPVAAWPAHTRSFAWAKYHGPAPVATSFGIPTRIRDAVPLRNKIPRTDFPVDAMVIGICPKDGGGVIRLRWRTRKNVVVTKEWLVPRGLPGEVVTVEFGKVVEKRWPKGDLDIYVNPDVKKVRPSNYEVRPQCSHYDSCGGCDFLDLRYGRQLVEKQRWIQQAMSAAKISSNVLQQIRPSEPQQRYAHRSEWMFTEEDGDVFFRPTGSIAPAEPPVAEPPGSCILPPRAAVRSLSSLCEAFMRFRQLRKSTYSVYDDKKGLGTFRSAVALSSQSPLRKSGRSRRTEVLLNIVLGHEVEDVEGVLSPLVKEVVAESPKCLVGIVANVARSKRTIMGGRREVLLYGRRYIRQALVVPAVGQEPHRFVLEVGAGSRLAAHGKMLPELSKTVLDLCALGETDTLWHCFCGGGELSLALGQVCENVVAIGTSATEVGELKRNLSANSISNTTAVLCNLRSPFTLKQLSFHISQSQQKRLLLGTGEEQAKARDFALTAFVPGESRRRQVQRLSAAPFTAPLLREDAMAHQELRALLPAFVRDFRPSMTTLPVPVTGPDGEPEPQREVPPEMESRLKRLYRRLALKYHPDKNPNDPEASERFQALTRAYKALVGDTAGPEEGDEDAQDPFLVAQASNYRPKAKHFWRHDVKARRGPGKSRSVEEEALDEDGNPLDPDTSARIRDQKAKVAEAFGAASDDENEDDEVWHEDEDEDDEELVVDMEIDDAWAGGRAVHAQSRPSDNTSSKGAPSDVTEVMLRDGDTKLTQVGGDTPAPTLPPPDVILVCQPRNRKKGKGTPRYFQSWLRSTAARAIVYVSIDPEAFQSDMKGLRELGYHVTKVQPFDPEPHRRPVLLVARLELVRPLEGLEDYREDSDRLLPGMTALLPTQDRDKVPLLGQGGYAAIPPP